MCVHLFFQSAIKAQSFRSLEEGEKVEFGVIESDKGKIAIQVSGIGGGNVKGASRKSRKKKGARKLTNLCFNCNAPGHLLKDCPVDRVGSRTCHQCGSNDHLIRKCPLLSEEQKKKIAEKRAGFAEKAEEKDFNDNSVHVLGNEATGNGGSSSEEGEANDSCCKRQKLDQSAGSETHCIAVNGHAVYNSLWKQTHDMQAISSCS